MLVEVQWGRVSSKDIGKCSVCKGSGQNKSLRIDCHRCKGSGRIEPSGYAYSAPEGVKVGDVVRVPGSEWYPGAKEATVVKVGSTYDGDYLKSVIEVVKRARTRAVA